MKDIKGIEMFLVEAEQECEMASSSHSPVLFNSFLMDHEGEAHRKGRLEIAVNAEEEKRHNESGAVRETVLDVEDKVKGCSQRLSDIQRETKGV